MIDSLPLPGTQPFLPTLLNYVRSAAPGLPLEPVIIQVLLLSIVSGGKNLILRTRDEDVSLVAKLTALVRSHPCLLHAKPCASHASCQETHTSRIK